MSEAKKLYEQGLWAEQQGRFQEALKYYKAAARQDAAFRPAFNNLGALYARAGRPDLAIGFFKRALELGADDIVNFNLGSEHFRLEQLNESESFLKTALRLNPRFLKAHILLAYLYEKQDRHDKADIYFKNALKLDPRNRMAALGLTVSLAERGLHEDALAAADKFLAFFPHDEALRNLRAGLLLKMNRYQESLGEFSELTKTSKKFTSFTDHIKAARAEQNDEYDRVFEGVDDKIKERTRRLRAKIEKRKELMNLRKGQASPPVESAEELKENLKDMVDLSFLHLFNGDTEKALQYLLQARKMKQNRPGP